MADVTPASPVAAKNGKTPPQAPSAEKKKPKGWRSPLERTFSQVQNVAQDLKKLKARFDAWKVQPTAQSHNPTKQKVEEAAGDLSDALGILRGVADTCSSLTSLGFKPAEVSGGGLQPGDRVELKKAAYEKWVKLADHKDDLLHLVVARVVGSDVVVDITTGGLSGAVKRLGVLARGSLQVRKVSPGGDR